MMKTASLSFVLGLALLGCADRSVAPGDDGSGDGSGSQEQPPEPQMDASGTYRLNSQFDLATNMPGNSGSFVNGLISATDDPDDPMSWVLDQMLDQMQPGTLHDILVGAKPFVAGYLNDRLTDLAPDLVATITELGHRMAELTKHFGLNEKLAVNSVDQTYIARVTADGVRWTIDGTTMDFAFIDHNIDDVYADNVLIAYDKNDSRLHIGEHTLPLPYGKLVRLGLDVAIIPSLDPNAHSLAELLDDQVNCANVGTDVADALGFGSAALWTSVCHAGLNQAANMVYDQIAAADSKLDMNLVGTARASDSNNDYKLDKLQFGTWSGTLKYDGADATLAQPATFEGVRQ